MPLAASGGAARTDSLLRSLLEGTTDCVKTLTLEGEIVTISEAARDLLQQPDLASLVGRSWISFWRETEQPEARAAVAAAAAGRTSRFVGSFMVADQMRWWDVVITPLRGASGVERLLAVSRDVTQHREGWWRASIVEYSDDAIITTNLEETIVSWNRGAEQMFGYQAAEMLGRSLGRLRPDDVLRSEPRILELLMADRRVDHYESVRLNKDGQPVHVSISASPIKDANGTVIGMAKILRDISERKRAEEAARRGVDQIHAMIDAAPVGIFVVDAQLQLVRINRRALPAFSHPGLIGRPLREVMAGMWPAATAAQVVADFEHTLATGEPKVYRGWSAMRADRAVDEHYDWEIQRLLYPDGQCGVACYFFDIGDHVRAQRALRETAGRLELAVQAARLGLWRWDAATDLVDLTPQAAEVFGLPEGAVMTWSRMQGLLAPGDREVAAAAVATAVAQRCDYCTEYRVRRGDGSEVWVAATGRPVVSGDQVTGMLGFVQDITARKRAEAERTQLLEQEQLARTEAEALTEAAQALTADLDLQATVQKATDVATRLTGAQFGAFFYNVTTERNESYTLYTLSGVPREAFAKFGLPRNTAVFGPTFKGEGVVRLDDVTADPRYGKNAPHHGMPAGHLPVRSYLAVPVISRTGEVLGGMFFGHPDVAVFTERAERIARGIAAQASIAMDNAKLYRRVQNTAERLDFSLSAMNLGDWTWDAASDLMTISRRTAEIYGFPPGRRMTREEMRAALHPEDRDRARAAARSAVLAKRDYDIEYRINHPARGICWIAARGRPVFDEQGNVTSMVGVVQDITDRKNAELHLRCQRDVLEQIVQSASLPEVLRSLTLWVEMSLHRRAIATILLTDEAGTKLVTGAGPSCPAAWADFVNGLPIADDVGSCGTAAFRRERVVVADVASDPKWRGFAAKAVEHGLRACWSTPILANDGGVLGTFAIYYPEVGTPEPGELEIVDVVTRTAAIAIERRRAEQALRDSREKLQQHAEMLEQRVAERTARLRETIGELEAFSYSVSHDMRAPLRAMQGYSDRLLRFHAGPLDEEARNFLTRINRNAQRLELLVRDVLAYSKVSKSEIELVPVDFDAFVAGLLSQIPELQRDDVTVTVERPLPRILGHEAYLSQILTNLLGNAVKFAAPDRPPRIRISARRGEQGVAIEVRDNGIGIAEEHFDRIFQIFGRVYPDKQYDGTGIGLAIVKKAVQRMGGAIEVQSQLGAGTAFTFTLQPA